MADRRVKVIVEAEVAAYRRGMEQAASSTEKAAKAAEQVGEKAEAGSKKAQAAASRLEAAQEAAAGATKAHEDAAKRLAEAQSRLNDALASKDSAAAAAAARDLSDAQRELKTAGEGAAKAQAELDGAVKASESRWATVTDAARKNADDIQQVSGVLAGAGAAMTAIAGSAAKAAMDWESAWAGVTKTNDGTAEQLANLQQGLRDMAGELPASHAEIAAVAEAAGQLGVGIEDVQEFTRAMIDLGESTNMTSDQAATNFARFANIMQMSLSDVDRLGSVVVDLGNNFATTESEISDMSMRLAGVGQQMGMSEADVMALATAMSSVGIEAEAGGTAMSTAMKKIDQDVRAGGDSLAGWARAAGTSAQEFADAWSNDPATAVDMLVTGLGEAGARGEDMNAILADLGVKGIRESDTLIRLAGASGVLADAIEVGNQAWDENSALTEEASKRYETAESRIRIAWNQIKDAAIEAGGVILPVVVEVMEVVGGLADVFAGLPDPVKGAIGGLAGVAGVALTVAGGVGMIVRPALDTVDAFKRLSDVSGPTKTKLDAIGKTTAVAAVLAAAAGAAIQLHNASQDAAPSLEAVANALLNMDEAGDASALNDLFRDGEAAGLESRIMGVRTEVTGLADALALVDPSSLGDHMQNFGADVFGIENHASRAQETLSNLDKTLATMGVEEAGEKMNGLRLEMEAAGRSDFSSWSELQRVMPEYTQAVEAAANATGKSTSEADLFQAAMGNLPAHMRPVEEAATDVAAATGDAADSLGALAQVDAESNVGGIAESMAILSDETLELEDRLSGVLDALFRMGILEQSAAEAAASFEAALDGVAAAVEENGATLDITTEAGRNNQAALAGIADAGRGLVTSLAEAGASQGELRDALERTYIQAYNAATAMGATSEEAEILARRAVGLNDMSVDIDTYLSDAALVAAEALGGAIEAIPGYRGVSVVVSDDGTTGTVQESIDEIDGVTRTVFVTTDGTEVEVQAKIENINGVDRTVWVDDQGTIYGTQQDIYAVTGKTVDIEAQATGLGTVEAELAWAARTRYSTIQTAVEYVGGGWESRQQQSVGVLRRAQGGIASLPGYSAGGVLPRTGLGTDMILGVTSSGMPIARVDDGEMIVRRSSTDMYRGVLDRINRNDPSVHHLRGYAGGGRAGREWSAQSLAPQITVQAPAQAGPDLQAVYAAAQAGAKSVVHKFQFGNREIRSAVLEADAYGRGR